MEDTVLTLQWWPSERRDQDPVILAAWEVVAEREVVLAAQERGGERRWLLGGFAGEQPLEEQQLDEMVLCWHRQIFVEAW